MLGVHRQGTETAALSQCMESSLIVLATVALLFTVQYKCTTIYFIVRHCFFILQGPFGAIINPKYLSAYLMKN